MVDNVASTLINLSPFIRTQLEMLAARFSLDQLILFGSRAKGTHHDRHIQQGYCENIFRLCPVCFMMNFYVMPFESAGLMIMWNCLVIGENMNQLLKHL